MNRPPLNASSVETVLASVSAVRSGTRQTPVATRSRVVTAAIMLSTTNGSDIWW
jgi:hypothetical protein